MYLIGQNCHPCQNYFKSIDLTNQVNPSGSVTGTLLAECVSITCRQTHKQMTASSTRKFNSASQDRWLQIVIFMSCAAHISLFLSWPPLLHRPIAELVKLISSLKSAQASSHKAPSQGHSHRGKAGQRPPCSPGSACLSLRGEALRKQHKQPRCGRLELRDTF